MAGTSKIEWCDATFNPWWGCERVSPACAHCYADTFSKRLGMKLWDDGHDFRFFGDKHWDEPLKWARTLPAKLRRRPRVFCASMADVFEERDELELPRWRLFTLIRDTPELDWLVLTKRPEFARDWLVDFYELYGGLALYGEPGERVQLGEAFSGFENVWMGVSIENARYTWRADVLREIPAAVRFISAEPLLGSLYNDDRVRRVESHNGNTLGFVGRQPLDLSGIDWIIIGGESGHGARPFHLEHAREIIGHAVVESYERTGYANDNALAVFVKQLGAKPVGSERDVHSYAVDHFLKLRDRKGGDMSEWPSDLRIREFPTSAVPA